MEVRCLTCIKTQAGIRQLQLVKKNVHIHWQTETQDTALGKKQQQQTFADFNEGTYPVIFKKRKSFTQSQPTHLAKMSQSLLHIK